MNPQALHLEVEALRQELLSEMPRNQKALALLELLEMLLCKREELEKEMAMQVFLIRALA